MPNPHIIPNIKWNDCLTAEQSLLLSILEESLTLLAKNNPQIISEAWITDIGQSYPPAKGCVLLSERMNMDTALSKNSKLLVSELDLDNSVLRFGGHGHRLYRTNYNIDIRDPEMFTKIYDLMLRIAAGDTLPLEPV